MHFWFIFLAVLRFTFGKADEQEHMYAHVSLGVSFKRERNNNKLGIKLSDDSEKYYLSTSL